MKLSLLNWYQIKQSACEKSHRFHIAICDDLAGSPICVDLGQRHGEFDQQRISLKVEDCAASIELAA